MDSVDSDANPLIDPRLLEQLPSLPGAASEFLRLCDDPHAGVRQVADAARVDPALVARILRVSNSPFYSPREPVTDVAHAAAILGVRSLKMIGVGFAIVGDLWSSLEVSAELSGLIGASTMAGSAARSLSVRLGTGRDEEALTSGLLAYIGELALLRAYPEEFRGAWAASGGLPDARAQREWCGTDGALVGLALMDRWHIPAELRGGARARMIPFEHRLDVNRDTFRAALAFGTAIGDSLAGERPGALDAIAPKARRWGLQRTDFVEYWSEFRVAVRRVTSQLAVVDADVLDRMIAAAKDEYLASQIAALDQFEEAHRHIAKLQEENSRLEDLSTNDMLTGISNRAGFTQQLQTELAALQRRPESPPLGVALYDLDHFKTVNDRHGHLVGDQLLKQIASAVAEAARTDEHFSRLGGDEFALLCRPDDAAALQQATERIRQTINDAAKENGHPQVTASAGATLMERVPHGASADVLQHQLLTEADNNLYNAKRNGRNHTQRHRDPADYRPEPRRTRAGINLTS